MECQAQVKTEWIKDSENQFLGRLIKRPGSPRRRQGSGILKKEEKTDILLSSTFLSLSHIKLFYFKPGTTHYNTNNSV